MGVCVLNYLCVFRAINAAIVERSFYEQYQSPKVWRREQFSIGSREVKVDPAVSIVAIHIHANAMRSVRPPRPCECVMSTMFWP